MTPRKWDGHVEASALTLLAQAQSALKETDGLKLTLEANLDIEIELKASIRGDLTLSLL